MEPIKEYRGADFAECRAAVVADDQIIRITGYGAVFNRWYSVYGYKERILPGAFKKTLIEQPDIRGMYNHDPNFLLGRTFSGTMDVAEDHKGLPYEIRADKRVTHAVSVAAMIERGDVDGSSMAFFVRGEDWQEKNGQPTHRTITEIELIETGPVTMPASPSTTAKLQRSLEEDGIDVDSLTAIAVKRRAGFRLLAAEDDFVARTIVRLERLKSGDLPLDTSTGLSPAGVLKYRSAAWALQSRLVATL
jgi:uncharacterized protein